MNKEWLIKNITESQDQLEEIISKLKKDKEYDYMLFEQDMHHAYWHMNLAYNTDKLSNDEIVKLNEEDIAKTVKKPIDFYTWS